jgi:hypothetical protein
MEVLLQDGLEGHSYNTPNRFDESIDRCPQEAGILCFCASPGAGSRGGTVINVLPVVGRGPRSVGLIQDSGSKAIGSLMGPVFPLSGSQVGSPS